MTRDGTPHIRLLYVEDDRFLQATITQMFTALGYLVECAENGKVGIEKAASWQPDLILMDVRLPLVNGDEAIRTLRSNPHTTNIPIIVLSAYTDAKTRNSCKEAGADRFFTKPPDVRKVDAAIKSMLKR